MQEENANTKRRKGTKWYEVEDVASDDEGTDTVDLTGPEVDRGTPDPRRNTNAQYAESTKPRIYKTGEQISFLGFDDEVMAHGTVLDDEPDTTCQESMLQYDSNGYWKYVDITTVARGWGSTCLEVSFHVWIVFLCRYTHTHTTGRCRVRRAL